MPETCIQRIGDKVNYPIIDICYREACSGASESFLIESSIKIQDIILDRIFDERVLEQLGSYNKMSAKAFVLSVKEGKLPIKFHGAEMWGKKDLADNEMRFYSQYKNVHLIFETLD